MVTEWMRSHLRSWQALRPVLVTLAAVCTWALPRDAFAATLRQPSLSASGDPGLLVGLHLQHLERGQEAAALVDHFPLLHHHRLTGFSLAFAAGVALGAWGLRAGANRAGANRAARSREARVQLGPFRRDLHLDGYPVHGPGYYWTLSKCTEAVLIYVPIADDVSANDVIFDCRDTRLRVGMAEEKGGLVIDDKVLYPVDLEYSYFLVDKGEYGERCIVVWLYKLTKEQEWYAYDRFEPKTERFLLLGEKTRAELTFIITNKVWMDINIDGKPAGRVVFGLYGNIAPRTVENFRALCTGEKGVSSITGTKLHYAGTRFHRIIQGFCIQGGQTFETEDGDGGESIYGLTFEDENLRVKFNKPGLLAMANGGPNTNGSQFFVTTVRATHLSYKSVGFGEVLEGMSVIRAIESQGDEEGLPIRQCVIADCGEINMEGKTEIGNTGPNVDLSTRDEAQAKIDAAQKALRTKIESGV